LVGVENSQTTIWLFGANPVPENVAKFPDVKTSSPSEFKLELVPEALEALKVTLNSPPSIFRAVFEATWET
jgi:hypothetical protein